jgi:hypothetical protein
MGISTAGKHFDGLKTHEKFYSESLQEYKEGTYTSLARFSRSIFKGCRALKGEIITADWNRLSDMEKGNIRFAVTELGIMLGALIASGIVAGLAKGADDDDEKKALFFSAYLLRRTYSELAFYVPVNVREASRLMRTPTATLSTVELFTNMSLQVGEDIFSNVPFGDGFEFYQRGKNEGKSKSWVLFNKTFNPIYKNLIARDAQKSYEFLTNTNF